MTFTTISEMSDEEFIASMEPTSFFQPGTRVAVPEHLYRPQCYDEAGEFHAVLGHVVEAHPTLLAIKFDLYPNTVDYTAREAWDILIIEESAKSTPAPFQP